MQQQLEQLKRNKSLRLVEGMPVKWPGNREVTELKVSNILRPIKGTKAYAYTSKVIAFVYRDEIYVTPYTSESLEIVRNAGYKLYEFFVPFSRGDAPQGEYGQKWSELIAQIRPVALQAVPATTASL